MYMFGSIRATRLRSWIRSVIDSGRKLFLFIIEHFAQTIILQSGILPPRSSYRILELIYAGLTKKAIKISTPESNKVFPLERMEIKTKPIADGSNIVVDLNEIK